MVRALSYNAVGVGSIHGLGTKIPCAFWPKKNKT